MSYYPTEFPSVEVKRLYSLAANHALKDNLVQAVHDSWWVGGFLAKYAVGEPNAEPGAAAPDVALASATTAIEKAELAKLSVLAGLTPDDLTQPGEGPEGFLDRIDVTKLLANVEKIVAMLKLLGIIP